MQKTKILMPVLVLGLMAALSSTAYGQVLSCDVTSEVVSNAADTGHAEQTGIITWQCSAAAAVAVNTATLTVDYPALITNDETGNQELANIEVTNHFSVDTLGAPIAPTYFNAANTPIIDVDNLGGRVFIELPGGTVPAGTHGFSLTGVLISTAGQNLSGAIRADLSVSAGSKFNMNQNDPKVLNNVATGILDPRYPFGGDRTATVLTNGVEPDPDADFQVTEGFIDFFRNGDNLATEVQTDPGNQYNLGRATNDTQVQLEFTGLFEDFELDCSIAPSFGSTGAPAMAPTTVDVDDDTSIVTFGADVDLTDTDSFVVDCTVDQGSGIDLPLPVGDVRVTATLAPLGDALGGFPFFPVLDGVTDGQIPRYERKNQPANGLVLVNIVKAQTQLLVPFATYLAPFDTGIAISNTSLDPWGRDGAEPVAGGCTFWFYPQDGSATIEYTTDASSPGVGLDANGELQAGTTYSVLLSELLAAAGVSGGFNGYIFIECEFTNGHGQAFVSDFSGFTTAADMLVVIIDNRPTQDESLGH